MKTLIWNQIRHLNSFIISSDSRLSAVLFNAPKGYTCDYEQGKKAIINKKD